MTTIIPRQYTDRLAHRFALLSVPARLGLVQILMDRGECSVQELVQASGLQQANVSKHLARLADGGFLDRRKDGLFVFYSVADPTLAAVCSLMCRQMDENAVEMQDA